MLELTDEDMKQMREGLEHAKDRGVPIEKKPPYRDGMDGTDMFESEYFDKE
jgi:5-bromo-4-chloroindolyl phosphate hydrolysis protein